MSGSYDGQIFFFKGASDGTFAAGEKLADTHGKEFSVGEGTSISLFDWNKDGHPDIFIGTIEGAVYFALNDGHGHPETPMRLSGGGQDMDAPDGGPYAADWDGDGVMDLFLGMESGQLQFFKGKAAKEKPEFEAPIDVLPALTEREVDAKMPLDSEQLDWKLTKPGMRPKPTLSDWNGDGKLDLLVGDMNILYGRKDDATPEETAKLKALMAKYDSIRLVVGAKYDAIKERVLKQFGWTSDRKLTPEESQRYSDQFAIYYQQDKELVSLDESMVTLFDEIRPISPPTDYHGFVWVFLKK